jgi:hypothetical protein
MKAKYFLLIALMFGTISLNSQFKNSHDFFRKSLIYITDTAELNQDIISKTDECDIFMKDRTGRYDVSILSLIDSSLKIEEGGNYDFINVNNINKIKFQKRTDFWAGAVIGAGISFTYFAFAAFRAHDNEGRGWNTGFALLSIVPAGLVGGLIGIASTPDDDLYDFSQGNPNAKMKRLRYIIEKHTPKMPFQK